ncbi:hypothetical protein [Gluconobacter oxydans]|uniref:hypothetical protein n=1 Tax=Gluconobacter oxydans TaxID=442 RepID=UPI003463B1E9
MSKKKNPNRPTQQELELSFLERAKPLLRDIYGDIEFISEQTDKPDAAFWTAEGRLVGIEIVEVDDKGIKEYFGKTRDVQSTINDQMSKIQKGEKINERPLKKIKVEQKNDLIFNNAKNKYTDYDRHMETLKNLYAKEGQEVELILLAHSDYVSNQDDNFDSYLLPWTNYHFSNSGCPYSKVIFTSGWTNEAKIIFDKTKPLEKPPILDKKKEKGKTVVQLNMIPADGKPYNIINHLLNSPVLTPPKKKK